MTASAPLHIPASAIVRGTRLHIARTAFTGVVMAERVETLGYTWRTSLVRVWYMDESRTGLPIWASLTFEADEWVSVEE